MHFVARAGACDGIAAQRHDVADAGIAVAADDLVDFALGGLHTGQMRGGHERGFLDQSRHGGVRALARRTAGAVGDGDEPRADRLEAADGLPQALFHLVRLGRKELERHADGGCALGYGTWGHGIWLVLVGIHATTSMVSVDPALPAGAFASRPRAGARTAQPEGNGQLVGLRAPLWGCGGRHVLLRENPQSRLLDPLRDLLRGEPEAAMGELLAQEFHLVRRKVDDHEAAGRTQKASGFANGARGIVEKVQDLMQHDDIGLAHRAGAGYRDRPGAPGNAAAPRRPSLARA